MRGLMSGDGRWHMEHEYPGDLNRLFAKPDLSRNDTRPGTNTEAAVCACGELEGAAYYAFRHNQTSENDTPIIIEFEAEISVVAVDGKDFLYTAFQGGDPDKARAVLECSFGTAVLRYAEKAWATENQSFRVAQCDLAIHDPDVIEAHYLSSVVLGGLGRTVFRNAFTVALPVRPEAIQRVWLPNEPLSLPMPDVLFSDILRNNQ